MPLCGRLSIFAITNPWFFSFVDSLYLHPSSLQFRPPILKVPFSPFWCGYCSREFAFSSLFFHFTFFSFSLFSSFSLRYFCFFSSTPFAFHHDCFANDRVYLLFLLSFLLFRLSLPPPLLSIVAPLHIGTMLYFPAVSLPTFLLQLP